MRMCQQLLAKPYLNPMVLKTLFALFLYLSYACRIRWLSATLHSRQVSAINPNTVILIIFLDRWVWRHAMGGKNEVCYVGGMVSIRGLVTRVCLRVSTISARLVWRVSNSWEAEISPILLDAWMNWGLWIVLGSRCIGAIGRSETCIQLSIIWCASNQDVWIYMSAGIPVIASNFPLGARHRRQWLRLCVDPLDPAIARAIDRLVMNPDVLPHGENGRQAVLTAQLVYWRKKLYTFYETYECLYFRNPRGNHYCSCTRSQFINNESRTTGQTSA